MFDNVDRDRDDLLRLGNLACDKLRDGVDVRDGDALADIAGGIKVANGERSGPQGYGFIVGLSASTRCVDYLAASDLSCTGQTIVFAALAVSRVVQQRDRVGIWRVVQTLRPLRTATIVINGVAGQFPPEIPPGHREILDKIGLEVGH